MDSDKPISQLINPIFTSSNSEQGVFDFLGAAFRLVFGVVGFFVNVFAIIFAVLAGNYVGDKLRAQVSGKEGHQLEFIHQDEHGNTFLAANLLLSNFLPGVLLALLLQPRVVFGFLGGMVASFFLEDRYEDEIWESMDEILAGGDPTRNWPTASGQIELENPARPEQR